MLPEHESVRQLFNNVFSWISISSKSDKETLYRLTELIVDWILANPTPILLGDVDYKR